MSHDPGCYEGSIDIDIHVYVLYMSHVPCSNEGSILLIYGDPCTCHMILGVMKAL